MVLEGLVTGTNKGGLTLDIKKIRAFMPISQIERERVHDASLYVGRRLQCEVTSFDRASQNLVVSRRAILDREAEEARAAALERLTEGDVILGTVTRCVDFGAFIDLGGFEGLLHQSKIREHHREIGKDDPLVVGQELEVEILRIDQDRGRVALDFRRRPVSRSGRSIEGYAAGVEVTGWVKQLTDDGAVLALDDGVVGLIPTDHVTGEISDGSVVRATVTRVDQERGRLELKPI
jgi:small subunit ribosomal protein S1